MKRWEEEMIQEYNKVVNNTPWKEIKKFYTYDGCQAAYAETIDFEVKKFGYLEIACERGCPIIYLKWLQKNKEEILKKDEERRKKEKKENRWWKKIFRKKTITYYKCKVMDLKNGNIEECIIPSDGFDSYTLFGSFDIIECTPIEKEEV